MFPGEINSFLVKIMKKYLLLMIFCNTDILISIILFQLMEKMDFYKSTVIYRNLLARYLTISTGKITTLYFQNCISSYIESQSSSNIPCVAAIKEIY